MVIKTKIIVITLCIIGLTKVALAASAELTPFESVNQSPFVSIYGLPGCGNFLLLPDGHTEVGLGIALTNNYTVNDNSREHIILDGETTRFTFAMRHTFLPRFEVGIKIPYIVQGGGFLDGFIENYHRVFGFPQGGRDQAPRNRLLYRYRRDGVDRVLIDSSGSGIGDVRLTAAYQLYEKRESNRGMALNFGIKLPAGDSGQLMGSGSTDLSLWITGGTDLGIAAGRWAYYGSAGILFMTEGEILPDRQKKWAGFGSLGIGWTPLSWLDLKVQADAHTPFFGNSDLREIASNALQLIVGGTVSLPGNAALDAGVSEDLAVSTSPDVVFYLTLRNRF